MAINNENMNDLTTYEGKYCYEKMDLEDKNDQVCYKKKDLEDKIENNSLDETNLETIKIQPREMKESDYLRLEKKYSGGNYLSQETNRIFVDIYKCLHEICDGIDEIESEYLPPKEEKKFNTEKVTQENKVLFQSIEISPNNKESKKEKNNLNTDKVSQKCIDLYKPNEIAIKYIFPKKEEKKLKLEETNSK